MVNFKSFMTWNQIHKIQEYKVLKSMYVWLFIVPIFAKLTVKIEDSQTLNMPVFGSNIDLTLGLPFTWQIFYFSALFIVLGDVFFKSKCPSILQDHESFSHFNNEGKSVDHLIDYTREIHASSKFRTNKNFAVYVDNGRSSWARGVSSPVPNDKLQEMFWYAFGLAQDTNQKSRILTSLFYYLGLGLIGLVLLENLWFVLKAIIKA